MFASINYVLLFYRVSCQKSASPSRYHTKAIVYKYSNSSATAPPKFLIPHCSTPKTTTHCAWLSCCSNLSHRSASSKRCPTLWMMNWKIYFFPCLPLLQELPFLRISTVWIETEILAWVNPPPWCMPVSLISKMRTIPHHHTITIPREFRAPGQTLGRPTTPLQMQ